MFEFTPFELPVLYFRLKNLRFHQYSCNEANTSSFLSLDCKNVCSGVKECLIDVQLVKLWLLESFTQRLTSSYYSYLRVKGLINTLCAPSTMTFSSWAPEQRASCEQKLFPFYASEERKTEFSEWNTNCFSDPSIRIVTGKKSSRKKNRRA